MAQRWKKNEGGSKMFKSFAYGLLVGIIIAGVLWYSTGRNDLRQIRSDYEGAAGNLQRVQRIVSELGTDSDGFARDITSINTTSKRIADRSGRINEGLTGFDGDFGIVTGKVEQLEKWNRRSLILGRDFGDQLFYLRQLNKESRAEE